MTRDRVDEARGRAAAARGRAAAARDRAAAARSRAAATLDQAPAAQTRAPDAHDQAAAAQERALTAARPAELAPLPASVCFRVTRACNARCAFCLAPFDGSHPDARTLLARVDLLLARGVRKIDFCGGEPTIHPALGRLCERVRARGGAPVVTTNGIRLEDALLATLRATRTAVRVSVHGDREQHDRAVGRPAYDAATANARRLVRAGVDVAIQTTALAGGLDAVEHAAALARELGARRLVVLPFLPRGDGRELRARYALASAERVALKAMVRRLRRAHSGILDVRLVDLTARAIPVVEPDGRVVLEGATESLDRVIARLPEREE